MKSFLQILGTGTGDMSPSCLLFYDQARFLINCGEGSQRFFIQHKIKFSKLNTIFLTRLSWDRIGGLPGLTLTAADSGSPFMRIFGPRNSKYFIASLRGFIQRSKYPLAVHELQHGDKIEIDPITVQVIELFPKNFKQISIDKTKERERERDHILNNELSSMFEPFDPFNPPVIQKTKKSQNEATPDVDFHPSENSTNFIESLPKPTTPALPSSLCYIIHGPKVPGKFCADKALSLGVPSGPLRGLLTKGKSITLPNGNVIHPEQCIDSPRAGSVCFYIDIPSVDFIPSLIENNQDSFSDYTLTSSAMSIKTPVKCIVHQLGPSVLHHCQYQKWMLSFGPQTYHIILGDHWTDKRLVFTSSALLQSHLNKIYLDAFPLPYFSTHNLDIKMDEGLQIFQGKPLLLVLLEPSTRMDMSDTVPETTPAFESNKRKYSQISPCLNGKDSDPKDNYELCFLGTGSAIPSKYRNVSGIHLSIDEFGGMLLDCGEGTYGQLFRKYGKDGIIKVLKNLKSIFISHLHADHHLGVIQILAERKKIDSEDNPLFIIGPEKFKRWLEEYNEIEHLASFIFIESNSLYRNSPSYFKCKTALHLFELLSLKNITTIPVFHTPSSYAVIIDSQSGWRIVYIGCFYDCFCLYRYSGDTRECYALAKAGLNADVLIHEATFDNDMEKEAMLKNHSTFSEALRVATQMKAKCVILNHFSQRYPIIPSIENLFTHDDDGKNSLIIGVSFDLMTLRHNSIQQLPFILEKLRHLDASWKLDSDEDAKDI